MDFPSPSAGGNWRASVRSSGDAGACFRGRTTPETRIARSARRRSYTPTTAAGCTTSRPSAYRPRWERTPSQRRTDRQPRRSHGRRTGYRRAIVANPNHLDDWIDFTQKIIAPFDSSVALCTSNTDLLSALRARNCNAVSAPPSLDLDDTPFQSATTFLVTSAEEAEAFSNLITSFELGLRKAIFIATKSEQWLLLSKNVTSSEIFDITSLTAS